MGNIIFGVLFIIGGAYGEFALKGTNSPVLLGIVGIGLLIKGLFDLSKNSDEVTLDSTTPSNSKFILLTSLDNPQESIGSTVYEPDSQILVGELVKVTTEEGKCLIKYDFDNDVIRDLDKVMIAIRENPA